MNKTISINLSGQVFQIDEQAYDNLRNYLESIRRHFSVSDGGQEIIADIEARIAEMFSEKLNDRKQVITLADVADMMQHMGKPEEFETAGIDEEPANQQRTAKRLFRNPDDKLIAGVCSGISAYLGIEDPLWMRLAFVFALIFGFGSPVFIYIILWLIVPEAKTASEKLQMRGENINISNIEKTIKADLKDLKTRLENINTKEGTRKARNFFERTIALLVSIVVLLLRAVVKLTAMLLILIGLLIIFGLMAAIAFPAYTDGVSIPSLYPLFFESKGLVFLAVTGIALLAGIPALGIALAGFRLLLNNRRRIKGVGISLFGLWLVGLGCVVFVAIKTASEFRTSATVRTELPLVQPSGDTLYIESHNEKIPASSAELEFFEEGLFTPADSDFIASGRVKLDIKKSPTADFQLIREVEAQARNHSIASRKAQAVVHKVTQNDSVLIISGLISFPASHHFRGQEVQLTLQMPEGKSIFISEAVSDMLFDVENTSNIYDRDMGGHVWTMLPAGLACLDCDITEKNSPFTKGNVSREFDYRDFSEIAAAGAFNIEVRHGSEFRITADGSQRFIDHLDIEKDGKRLIIEMRHGINFFVRDKRANVSITLPELSRLKITGANRAVITGFSGDEMDLQVAGASEVDMHSSYKRLTVEVTGASSLVLSGKGNDLDVNVSGASRLKAFGYQTATCNIKVNGASKAEVNVSGQLDADANGASEILYKGLPKISSDVTGFSSIKPSQ